MSLSYDEALLTKAAYASANAKNDVGAHSAWQQPAVVKVDPVHHDRVVVVVKTTRRKRLAAHARTVAMQCKSAVFGCMQDACGEFSDDDGADHKHPVSGWG